MRTILLITSLFLFLFSNGYANNHETKKPISEMKLAKKRVDKEQTEVKKEVRKPAKNTKQK